MAQENEAKKEAETRRQRGKVMVRNGDTYTPTHMYNTCTIHVHTCTHIMYTLIRHPPSIPSPTRSHQSAAVPNSSASEYPITGITVVRGKTFESKFVLSISVKKAVRQGEFVLVKKPPMDTAGGAPLSSRGTTSCVREKREREERERESEREREREREKARESKRK